MPAHYRAPGWLTRNVFNRAVAFLTRHGVSVQTLAPLRDMVAPAG